MISVISDSHVARRAEDMPKIFYSQLEKSEINVHCGDFVSREFKEKIEAYGELYCVKGNCDRLELEPSRTFRKGGLKFGVYHGSGITPRGHHPTLVKTAKSLSCDVLFHGHSHQEEAVKKDGKILINPGSCTGVGGGTAEPGNPTMAKIFIDEGVRVKIMEKREGALEVKEDKNFRL